MNKNIIHIAICAFIPFNLAMSMEEQLGQHRRKRSNTIVVSDTLGSDSGFDRDHGFKLKRTLPFVAENQPNVADNQLNVVEIKPKFKGHYLTNSTSKNIFSRVPLSKFFERFDPSRNAEETAKALMKLGISTSSSPEIVQKIYIGHLIQLIQDENENPANYIDEITGILSFFNDIYSNIVKTYIQVAEEGVSSAEDVSSEEDAHSVDSEH